MSGDPFQEYREKEIKKDGRRKTGYMMLGAGVFFSIVGFVMPIISADLGLASWPVSGFGFVLFFGGLIVILTNLKKKPPKMEGSMDLDELERL